MSMQVFLLCYNKSEMNDQQQQHGKLVLGFLLWCVGVETKGFFSVGIVAIFEFSLKLPIAERLRN